MSATHIRYILLWISLLRLLSFVEKHERERESERAMELALACFCARTRLSYPFVCYFRPKLPFVREALNRSEFPCKKAVVNIYPTCWSIALFSKWVNKRNGSDQRHVNTHKHTVHIERKKTHPLWMWLLLLFKRYIKQEHKCTLTSNNCRCQLKVKRNPQSSNKTLWLSN